MPTTPTSATAIDPRVQAYQRVLEALAQLPLGSGDFDETQKEGIRPLLQSKPLVFLAFPPKCGGTFLREAVGHALGELGEVKLLRGSFVPAGNQEQDLYFPGLLTHFLSPGSDPALIHNHTLATDGNRSLIRLFGLKPVVMRRSIQDMLRSRFDQALHLGRFGGHGSGMPPESFLEQSPEAQKDFLVYNVAPWYVKFYASWFQAVDAGTNVLFVDFEDLRTDAAGLLRRILAFSELEVEDARFDAAVQHATELRDRLRFNKGVSGRGEAFFTDAHREHLDRLVQLYLPADERWRGLVA